MSKFHQAFRLSALSAALIAAYGPAMADDEEMRRLTKPESSISIGVGGWTDDRPQEGIYDGMRERGIYGLFDVDVVKRDEATGTWLSLTGRNLGLDTRELSVEWLRQGNMGATFEYSRIPRVTPYNVNTGLIGFGTTTQTRVTVTPGTGATREIGTVRDNYSFGLYKNIVPGVDLNFKFTTEDKTGTRHNKRGGAAEFAVEPFDSTTQIAEATLSYVGEKLQLKGGYIGNWYRNHNNLLTAVGPNAANTFYISLPLDNEAHQVFLDGGFNFTPTTRATFKLAYTKATQDEHIPTVDVAGLALAGSPESLDGRLDTTLAQLGLTSRPTKDLSVVASVRYHHVDEKTPINRYVQTGAGTCATTQTCVDNTPLSFETLTGKLEATYRLPMQFSLIGGIDYSDQDRTVPVGTGSIDATGIDRQRYVPFKSNLEETTYRLQLRRAMSETLNGAIAYLFMKRDGSSYTATEHFPSDLINPIHIADRDRNKLKLSVEWTPTERLSLQGVIEEARDDYGYAGNRPYGLRDGSASLYSIDANFAINDDWKLTGWYSRDRSKAHILGARWNRVSELYELDQDSRIDDTGDVLGIGLRGKIGSKFSMGADLEWARTYTDYHDDFTTTGEGAGLTAAFPNNTVAFGGGCTPNPPGVTCQERDVTRGTIPLKSITNQLLRLRFYGDYALDKNASIRVDLIHERWNTNDWTWQFSDGSPFIYGAGGAGATDGSMVLTVPKQKSNFLGVRYNYTFQ